MPNYKFNNVHGKIEDVSQEKLNNDEIHICDIEHPDVSDIKPKETQNVPFTEYEESQSKTKDIEFNQPSENDDIDNITSHLRKRGFIESENWNSPIHIGGKIVEISDNIIIVECLVNKENNYYQIRRFPKILFEDLLYLNEGDLILIRIRLKAGSQRIDIFNAKGMSGVKQEDFEYSGNWEGVDNSLSEPLPEKW